MAIYCDGKSGRLAILWRDDIEFKFLLNFNHHIHGIPLTGEVGEPLSQTCFLTKVYRHPELAHGNEVWALIKSLVSRMGEPWVVFGDSIKLCSYLKRKGEKIDQKDIWGLLGRC